MVTPAMSKEQFEWIVECNQRLPRAIAATLLYNHLHMDWRDKIVRIRQPTLIIGGRKSMIPWRSQVWINQSIPDSELEIFEEAEGGGHFMFIENPEKFNRRVLQFLSRWRSLSFGESLEANQERHTARLDTLLLEYIETVRRESRALSAIALLGLRLRSLLGLLAPSFHVTGSPTLPTSVVSNEPDGMQGTKARLQQA